MLASSVNVFFHLIYRHISLKFSRILSVDMTLLDCHYFLSPREGADHNENRNQLVPLTSKHTQHGGDSGEEGGGAAIFFI